METSNTIKIARRHLCLFWSKRNGFFYFVVWQSTYTMAENPEGGASQESGGYDYKRLHSYPLIRVSRWNVRCKISLILKIHFSIHRV